ncbi:hypothetical protein NUBL17187_07940 [Klebsiella michiganensis]|nr:hypothetical protein TUM17563_13700 [Klebsiella oxytoca]GKQ17628.1 hypothetical protein NUBL21980_08450 [Klebsiella michiganensis]GKQ22998.1 hypothetical protein NUBL17187_07940 [Klebsiella michiganensis]
MLKGDVSGGIAGKAGVAGAGLALGARQRILFAALRMQEHGKITAYLLVARVEKLLRRGANHDPIFVFNR